MSTTEITLEVNGVARRLAIDPRTSLLDLRREQLGLGGRRVRDLPTTAKPLA